MRVTRGQGFDPRLGLLDYSGYERAAATRAQGMQQLSQSIGEAIKGYREERENEKFRDQFAQDLATKIGRKTPEGGIDENAAKELAYYNIDTVALEGLSPAEQFEAISAGLQGRDREELQKAKDVYALQDLEQRNLRSRIKDEQEFSQKQFESTQELQQKLANQEIKHRNDLAQKDQDFRLKLLNLKNDFEQTQAINQHERELAILTQEHENKMAQIKEEETALYSLTMKNKEKPEAKFTSIDLSNIEQSPLFESLSIESQNALEALMRGTDEKGNELINPNLIYDKLSSEFRALRNAFEQEERSKAFEKRGGLNNISFNVG